MYSGSHHTNSHLPSTGLKLYLDTAYTFANDTDLLSNFPEEHDAHYGAYTEHFLDEAWQQPSLIFRGHTPEHAEPPVIPSNSINPVFLTSMLTLPAMSGSPIHAPSPLSDASGRGDFFSTPSTGISRPIPLPTTSTQLPIRRQPEPEAADPDFVPSDNDDDEYHPSSSRSTPYTGKTSKRQRRRGQVAASGRKARSDSPSSPPPPPEHRAAPYPSTKPKRKRAPPPSRVHQVTGTVARLMLDAIEKTDVAVSLNFICPDELCNFTMSSKPRMPDFRRHLKAHLRVALGEMGKGHVCKGITLQYYRSLSERQKEEILRVAEIGGESESYTFKGELRLGGCRYPFSRGDALTRHIKCRTNPCIGLVSGRLEGLP